jgi:hypothetical protein
MAGVEPVTHILPEMTQAVTWSRVTIAVNALGPEWWQVHGALQADVILEPRAEWAD